MERTAKIIVAYDAKARVGGGYKLGHQPSSYGLVLKWLIKQRKMTYDDFAKAYNGTTGQNVNNIINRTDKTRFFEENVVKMCEVVGVTVEYFTRLAEEVEKIMEK